MSVKTVFEHLRDRLFREPVKPTASAPSLEHLRKSEWSPEFEMLMRNRLVFGALRYGLLHAKNKPQYDRVASARKRLDAYERTGNLEHLVDVANMMLLEFEEGTHPGKHFHSVDDGEHTPIKRGIS